jgi:hypothetical protein
MGGWDNGFTIGVMRNYSGYEKIRFMSTAILFP